MCHRSSRWPPALPRGEALTNRQVMDIFHCACEGGIRPANATNSIILVLNHTKMDHADDWHGDILWFRGAGANGDQTLAKGRNKTLASVFANGRPVFLFEVFKQGEYTWQGQVRLAGEPFQQEAPGSDGKMRKVWIFPLAVVA